MPKPRWVTFRTAGGSQVEVDIGVNPLEEFLAVRPGWLFVSEGGGPPPPSPPEPPPPPSTGSLFTGEPDKPMRLPPAASPAKTAWTAPLKLEGVPEVEDELGAEPPPIESVK